MRSNVFQTRQDDARLTSTRARPVPTAIGSLPQTARALQRSLGNRATEMIVTSLVQRKGGKGSKGTQKEAPQEEKWKENIAEFGFPSVEVAGGGTENADIRAKDAERLWLFEVKGDNDWMSESNLTHTGNVPAKQLSGKLSGNLDQNLSTPKVGSSGQKETLSVKDYILGADVSEHARDQLLLGASKMDIEDALLGLKYDSGADDFKFTKGASIPLSINSVLRYLNDVVDTIPDYAQRQDYKSNHAGNVAEIQQAWDDYPDRDGRAFFVTNPAYLTRLEAAYSALRRTAIFHTIGNKQLEQIGNDIEYKFIPVVRDLTKVEKPEK
jgi:hypothetical protein